MLLAYFSPETVLPATSILAAGAGFVLMFGKQLLRFPGRVVRRIAGGSAKARPPVSAIPAPHLGVAPATTPIERRGS